MTTNNWQEAEWAGMETALLVCSNECADVLINRNVDLNFDFNSVDTYLVAQTECCELSSITCVVCHRSADFDATVKRSIFIWARLWVDKTYGNTYWSSKIYVDGKLVKTFGMIYGYDLAWQTESLKWLNLNGYFDSIVPKPPIFNEARYLRNKGIDLYTVETYVKKSELFEDGDN